MRKLARIAALLVAAGTLFAGAPAANAADNGTVAEPAPQTLSESRESTYAADKEKAVTITDVKVEDVGAHSAGLKVSYSIDPEYKDQIKSICPVAYVNEISTMTYHPGTPDPSAWGVAWDSSCKGVSDEDLTQEDYEKFFGEHTGRRDFGTNDYVDYTYREWVRYYPDAWDTETRPATGTFDMTLVGLQPNHFYGNRNQTTSDYEGYTSLYDLSTIWGIELRKLGKFNQPVNVDVHTLSVGAHIEFNDGTTNMAGNYAYAAPGFTTGSEPTAPSEETVLGSDRNGVTAQDGNAKQGSVYRLYVRNLSAECKAKLDATDNTDPCIWYGYIYSTPTALTDPSGAPYLEVQKDSKATDPAKQYYVDAYIPKTVADGKHTIALTDGEGQLQGWTDVTVDKDGTAETAKEVTVYRLFNPNETRAGSHHYTSSLAEVRHLTALGWKDEGQSFVTVDKGKPVYRAYNPNDGSHFYTLSKVEFDHAIKAGWHDEGIGFYVSEDAKVPLYRVYNPNSGEHFYTVRKAEVDFDVAHGWKSEDIAWNVLR
ncbi:hypothetical protein [Bifidobacterium callitrichos]|uniref:Glycosyl hydrolase family 25 n=1 Tax=Bifidobacterium callitrichos DSM 23973 TaxID=1437609 RepID=A0A087A4X3_9BIFI|nr:hypothetical protein [Bifidobacterium callitrichos]KFI53823.1 glycosyl hydrolase family 25 [Bifidobacterium callitrichos DSM 23973]